MAGGPEPISAIGGAAFITGGTKIHVADKEVPPKGMPAVNGISTCPRASLAYTEQAILLAGRRALYADIVTTPLSSPILLARRQRPSTERTAFTFRVADGRRKTGLLAAKS